MQIGMVHRQRIEAYHGISESLPAPMRWVASRPPPTGEAGKIGPWFGDCGCRLVISNPNPRPCWLTLDYSGLGRNNEQRPDPVRLPRLPAGLQVAVGKTFVLTATASGFVAVDPADQAKRRKAMAALFGSAPDFPLRES
jgi:hypothetical protein